MLFNYSDSIPAGLPGVWYPCPPLAPLLGGNICKFASGTAVQEQGKEKKENWFKLNYNSENTWINWNKVGARITLIGSDALFFIDNSLHTNKITKGKKHKLSGYHNAYCMCKWIVIKETKFKKLFADKPMFLFQPTNRLNISKTLRLINKI